MKRKNLLTFNKDNFRRFLILYISKENNPTFDGTIVAISKYFNIYFVDIGKRYDLKIYLENIINIWRNIDFLNISQKQKFQKWKSDINIEYLDKLYQSLKDLAFSQSYITSLIGGQRALARKNPYKEVFETKPSSLTFIFEKWYIVWINGSVMHSTILKFDHFNSFGAPIFQNKEGKDIKLSSIFSSPETYNTSKFFGPFVNYESAHKFQLNKEINYLEGIGAL